jgi:hypothetical protein
MGSASGSVQCLNILGTLNTARHTVSTFIINDVSFFLMSIPLITYSYGVEVLIFFYLWIYIQLVGLLERVIGPSQGLYLNTGQHKHRIKAHTHTKHPCPKWDSNPRSESERAKTVHALDRSDTVTGFVFFKSHVQIYGISGYPH